MPDTRAIYAALQPFAKKNGDLIWFRVGLAYRNLDGTIDLYFDAIIVGHRLRLRELGPDDTRSSARRGAPS